MHILITGASGHVGSHTLIALLAWTKVERITAVDIVPLPAHIALEDRGSFSLVDLADPIAVDKLFSSVPQCDAVIHLGAIPNPETMDHRLVHNINVTSNYNVLYTAVRLGVKRIVQASSVNAIGLSYTMPEHRRFDAVPLNEDTPCRPEDAYGLSKRISEIQADAIVRLLPDARIASIRLHMVRPAYSTAWPDAEIKDLWGWVSYASAAHACILGLTSEGWRGHEVFNIVADKICWEGGLEESEKRRLPSGIINDVKGWARLTPSCGLEEPAMEGQRKVTSLELLEKHWPGTQVKEGWWSAGNERRGFWDTTKAERLLGWRHEG